MIGDDVTGYLPHALAMIAAVMFFFAMRHVSKQNEYIHDLEREYIRSYWAVVFFEKHMKRKRFIKTEKNQ